MSADLAFPGSLSLTAYTLPHDMDFQQWSDVVARIGRLAKASRWWAVDVLCYGEDHFGEQYAGVIDALGYSPHTIENLLSLGRKFPPTRRRESLTVSHHDIVRKMDPAEQDRWLDEAETNQWSSAELRAAIKEDGGSAGGGNGAEAELALTLNEDGSIQAIKLGETFCITHGTSKDAFLDVAGRRFRFFSVNGVRITEQQISKFDGGSEPSERKAS